MATLIIGGTGKTGSRLASLLLASGQPYVVTSRSGKFPSPHTERGARFDWDDASTFENPFQICPAGQKIDKVYFIIPDVMDPLPVVTKFLDLAKKKGIKRFVLLGASPAAKGEKPHGRVHEYLTRMRVEYAVLRPTWFSENFGTDFLEDIRRNACVWSVAKDGRIPFVSADDIAVAAFGALTCKKSWDTDKYIVGPELLSYDQATALLSHILGRKIVHKRLTPTEEREIWLSMGNSVDYAEWLVKIEEDIALGSEERILKEEKKIVGKKTLKQYFLANRSFWIN